MTAVALAICLVAFPAAGNQNQPMRSVYEAGLARPTGRNGYEEYLRAGKIAASEPYRAYARWMVAIQGDGERPANAPPGMKPDATILEARDGLRSRFGKALELIRAGNAKPIADPSAGADFSTLFDHLADFKSVTRMGVDVAYADFAHGRTAAANDVLLDLLQFSQGIAGANLISFLVGGACEAIVSAVYARHLERLSVSDLTEIERWAEGRLAAPPLFLSALEGELQGCLRSIDTIFSGSRSGIVQTFGEFFGETSALSDKLLKLNDRDLRKVGALARAQVERELREGLRYLSVAESNWISLEEPEAPPGGEDIEAIASEIASTVIPLSAAAANSAAIRRTQLRLLRLHAMVLRYRWDHDRLPSSLSEVGAKEDLVDPITGQPFQYELRDGTYRLFSKGWGGTGEIELRYRRPIERERSPESPIAMIRSVLKPVVY